MDAFLREIQNDFLVEAGELLADVESFFMVLEKDPNDEENLHKIFRLVHNFKGSGKTVGFEHLSAFCHEVENLLVSIRNKVLPSSSSVVQVLLESCDRLRNDVEILKQDPAENLDYSELTLKIQKLIDSSGEITDPTPSEIASVKTFSQPLLVEKKKPSGEKAGSEDYIRLPLRKVEDLINTFGEQVILQSTLELAKQDFELHRDLILKTISQLSKLTHDLQQTTMSLRMVSLKNMFSRIERAVRDVAQNLGKNVRFTSEGQDHELDKAIVELLIDPLTHMARNSVDHGIETSQDRQQVGKPAQGSVHMKAYHQGGMFVLELKDDGKGLDPTKILDKALSAGIIKSREGLTKKQIYDLIFQNGFSTKDEVSDISGRGVGMNVVLEAINKLRGTYEIESEVGLGTCFRIKVPLTLAVFNGMIVKVARSAFVISASDVTEVIRASQCEVRGQGTNAILRYKEGIFELVDIRSHVGEEAASEFSRQTVLLSTAQGKKRAFVVDELVSLQKIVHKKLDNKFSTIQGASGVTILGDGSVALILDLNSLAESFQRSRELEL